MDDGDTSFKINATKFHFSTYNPYYYEAIQNVSTGNSSSSSVIYGPVPAVRDYDTVHVAWTDLDDSDYGVYADWNVY